MATKTFYNKILWEIHLKQTHVLREFLNLTMKKNSSLSKNYLNEQIKKIQLEVVREDIRKLYKENFLENTFHNPFLKIQGRGVKSKKLQFQEWYSLLFTSNNFIYIFFDTNNKCLYVGRTGKGGSRPINHYIKYWFNRAKKIQLFFTRDSRKLNKLECLAIHYWKPIYNQRKSARQKRSHICPICDDQKYIETEMNKAFKV